MSPATSSHVAPTLLNERFERLPIGDVFPSKTNPRTHFIRGAEWHWWGDIDLHRSTGHRRRVVSFFERRATA